MPLIVVMFAHHHALRHHLPRLCMNARTHAWMHVVQRNFNLHARTLLGRSAMTPVVDIQAALAASKAHQHAVPRSSCVRSPETRKTFVRVPKKVFFAGMKK